MRPPVIVFYRTYGGENNARRPKWYNKKLCLKSLLLSFKDLDENLQNELYIDFDGHVDFKRDKYLIQSIKNITFFNKHTQIGNGRSLIRLLQKIKNIPDETVIIIAEDDYLWLNKSLKGLYNAITTLDIDYATPYDHPCRYFPDPNVEGDLPLLNNSIYVTPQRHWRNVESTTMTFAAKASTIKEDLSYFEAYCNFEGKNTPMDRDLFRHLQGLGEHKYHTDKPRILISPMPSLATHCHLPWLSPLINWKRVAEDVKEVKL
jgi:hypothetical protein